MPINIKGGSLVWQTKVDNSQLKKSEKETKGILSNMANSVSKADIFAGLGLSAALAFKHVVSVNQEFEKSLSSLQSILGLTKNEMTFFKEASIEMGAASTKTSQQVVDAFKLIGSQKPELLKDRDALKEVTQQAIILSEAAEIDVPVAAKALTNALNQMGESADQAARFVNVLAAGSKEGSADIPYLNAAIEKSGAVARDANLSFEQLVGAIETIAPSISEPTTAGLQFRDTLLRLQTAGKGYESGVFNLKDALTEVKAEFDAIEDPIEKVAAETDLFGKVSLVTGKALLSNIEKFENYSAAVTDTSTALEQQSINNDNLTGDLASFNSAVEKLTLSFNGSGGLSSSIRGVVQFGTELVNRITELGESFSGSSEDSSAFSKTLGSLFDLVKTGVRFVFALTEKFTELGESSTVVGSLFRAYYGVLETVFSTITDIVEVTADFLNLDLEINKSNANLEEAVKLSNEVQFAQFNTAESLKTYNGLLDATINKNKEVSTKGNEILTDEQKRIEALKEQVNQTNELAKAKGKKSASNLSEVDPKIAAEKALKDAQDLENLRIQIMREGTAKEIAEVEQRYKNLEEKALLNNLSTVELLQNKNEEIDKINADYEAKEQEKIDKKESDKKVKEQNEFIALQEKALNEFLLLETDAEKIKDFETQQEIEKLERKLLFEEQLTQIQRDAVQSRIDLLKKEEDETTETQNLLIGAAQQFGAALGTIENDSTKSAAENAEARKKILLNGVRDSVEAALIKVLASTLSDTFAKLGGIGGLIAAPILIGSAKALFNSVIPKFETGGIVGGDSLTGDNNLIRANSREMILTQKQQGNLFQMANNGGSTSNFDMNKILSAQTETNKLLSTQKTAVLQGNKMLMVNRSGNLTGDSISLS